MQSDRIQRQIDRLLDAAAEAVDRDDWETVRQRANAALAFDAANVDALAYLTAAEKASGKAESRVIRSTSATSQAAERVAEQPTSFADGRYRVVRFLGEGATKRVYLAHDTKLDRDVAFALIKLDGLDKDGLTRIHREAQAMGRLGDHPHIVSVFDIGDESGQPYILSQFMSGGDVARLIAEAPDHRVSLELALRIAEEVCQALEHAHSQGVIHRDLKPGNVWLTATLSPRAAVASGAAEGGGEGAPFPVAKLGDFGLAVALDRSRLTQAGMMVGTVAYMSPEQALAGEVTPRSDLYSLGCMLYELVTGRPPFMGDESVAIITQHLNTPPVAPSWHVPGVPPGLEAVILRLLEKDPAKRPASASEVRQILAGVGSPSPSPSPADGGWNLTPSPLAGEGWGEGARLNPIYRRTFVGREPELRQAQAAFDQAVSGQGSLFMLAGEPGVGKTAVCEQLATYVAVRGGKTLVGHCYEEGSVSLPYMAFVEALRTYVLTREPDALKKELGSGAAEVGRIVSEVRERLAVEPQPLAPGVNPEEDRWRLLEAVVAFLRNVSAVQPLVIVLEDLHWADRGTLDLLLHVARNLEGARLLVVGTYRDVEVDRAHPLSAALAELRRTSTYDRVSLRGLTADEVQRMLQAITGQEVSSGFAEAVRRQTEGNPLFVQEVVRYFMEEGLIRRQGEGGPRLATGSLEMSIPEGLRDVIGRRLSRLSPDCGRVLSVAAVIGRDFDLGVLRAIGGLDDEALNEALEEARRFGVVEEQTRPGLVRYRFAHAFFRQTLYEEMGAPRRLRLHQQVARALEAQHATRLEEHAAELAEHFVQSTDPADLEKAVEYGRLAAGRALGVYAYGEAARLLERALEAQSVLDPNPSTGSGQAAATRCDLLLSLGEALMPAGEPQRVADEVAPAAFALAQALGDAQRAAQSCDLVLSALVYRNSYSVVSEPSYRQWAERADHYAPPGTRSRVHADFALSAICIMDERWADAWSLAIRALDLARQLDDPQALFAAAQLLAAPIWDARHHEEWQRVIDEFTTRPRDGARTFDVAQLLLVSYHQCLNGGRRDRAEQMRRELERLAEGNREPAATLFLMAIQVVEAKFDGNLEGALAQAARMVTRGEELGVPAYRQSAAGEAFEVLIWLGKAAETLPETALMIGVQPEPWRAPMARCLAHVGRTEEARAELHQRLDPLDLSPGGDDVPASLIYDLMEAALVIGDREAVALLAQRAMFARHLGAAAALLGDRTKARADYDRALAGATKVQHRPVVALTRLAIAELLLDEALVTPGSQVDRDQERAEAMEHLDFAIREFEAMKMRPSLERALALRGRVQA